MVKTRQLTLMIGTMRMRRACTSPRLQRSHELQHKSRRVHLQTRVFEIPGFGERQKSKYFLNSCSSERFILLGTLIFQKPRTSASANSAASTWEGFTAVRRSRMTSAPSQ